MTNPVDNPDIIPEDVPQSVEAEPVVSAETTTNETVTEDPDTVDADSESSFTPDYVDVDDLNIQVPTEAEPLRDLTEKDRQKYLGNLAVLYTTIRELARFNASANGHNPTLSGDQLDDWVATVRQAATAGQYSDDFFERALASQNAKWDQGIVTDEGVRRGMGIPKVAGVSNGDYLTGHAALLKVATISGTGGTVVIPLPHTGIWITIKTPTLEAVTELDARVAEKKVDLGRSTRGLIFSNHQVYITKTLVEFAFDHVIDCNVVDWNPERLMGLIKQTDLPILAWGMAYAIYSTGFPISQPCTYDISKCMHITEKMVALNRLFRVNNTKLTSKQRKRLSMVREKNSPETLKAFEEDWSIPETVSYQLNENTRIVFKVPTLDEHIRAGDRWVTDIIENTERVLGPNVSPRDRNDYIRRQSIASTLLQYVHWIDRILIDEDGNQAQIVERDDIEKICLSLSSDAQIVNDLVSAVIKYINDVTVALIAIPNYPCPKCKKWHRTEHSPSKYLIPLDPVTSFFTLLQLKLLSTGILSGA